MLRSSSRTYMCWRCATRRVTLDAPSRRIGLTVASKSAPLIGRESPERRRYLATVHHSTEDQGNALNTKSALPKGGKAKEKHIPIRERLRQWEVENPEEAQSMMTDFAHAGEVSNSFTRPQNSSTVQFEVSSPLFEGDELGDLRSDDTNLRPGDMVEISSEGSRRPVLAVCLGRTNGYENYYTVSGRWFCGLGIKTLFVVHRFATPSEIEPIIAEIPANGTSLDKLNALQSLGHGPSRPAGAHLLQRMLRFIQDSEAIYQANASTLDASSSCIGDPVETRYLTLHEIADLVMPSSMKTESMFSPVALYAVHRSLMQDEIFFRPLRSAGHRRSYLFEVSPLSEVRTVQKIETLVRLYTQRSKADRETQPDAIAPLFNFIKNARQVIDNRRETRKFSSNGIIGPSKSPSPEVPKWSATDIEILQFMEMWASYDKFPSYSRLQGVGSAILRAIERYQESEALSRATGWTLLQEVGWITPWEIPSRYRVRFPEVGVQRGGGYVRPSPGTLDNNPRTDALEKHRTHWDGMTAFCIDSESTTEIDDAVSVERTSNPDQFWVHIHVADPASALAADTPMAEYAELIPATIYLPGHFDRMLPGDLGQEGFSLGSGKLCLTFSALVNSQGGILEHKITPGVLKDVVYITAEDVSDALEAPQRGSHLQRQELVVGRIPQPKAPSRNMTRLEDLTEAQMQALVLLSRLGKARKEGRLEKGATPFFQSRPTAEVFFDDVEQSTTPDGFIKVSGDPAIRVSYSKRSGSDLVENAMLLAGEVAARWCHERGIPIPYRTQPHALRNAALIQQYSRDVFWPSQVSGAVPDDNQWRHLQSLLGSDEISTSPAPHFTLGIDMYTKATSPLRRFSDLIVHWQIEAAMLEEHKRGATLVGNTDDSFLPFPTERLDRMLPMLQFREKQTKILGNFDGVDEWILQALVRAWRFGEAELPPTFHFTVAHVDGQKRLLGRLNWFDRPAVMGPETLNDLIKMVHVRVGDVFEVELKDVNVHSRQIVVSALKVLKSGVEIDHSNNVASAQEALTT